MNPKSTITKSYLFRLCLGPLVFSLFLWKENLGLFVFWRILLLSAPLIIFFLPGFWREYCPLAAYAILPRKLNLSLGKNISPIAQGALRLLGVFLLFFLVPLRARYFESSAWNTEVLLLGSLFVAIALSFIYDAKSAWCNALCPVFTVESLYGFDPKATAVNSHCGTCTSCSIICPERNNGFLAPHKNADVFSRWIKSTFPLLFPGFIFGYFQIHRLNLDPHNFSFSVYFPICTAMCVSFMLFEFCLLFLKEKQVRKLSGIVALSLYYFFQLLALNSVILSCGLALLVLSALLFHFYTQTQNLLWTRVNTNRSSGLD